jgi:hypothetical protein
MAKLWFMQCISPSALMLRITKHSHTLLTACHQLDYRISSNSDKLDGVNLAQYEYFFCKARPTSICSLHIRCLSRNCYFIILIQVGEYMDLVSYLHGKQFCFIIIWYTLLEYQMWNTLSKVSNVMGTIHQIRLITFFNTFPHITRASL